MSTRRKSVGSPPSPLRRCTETLAQPTPQTERKPRGPDAKRSSHEVELHQFELELQNEELTEARSALESNLDLYTELFDFAPLGYATLALDQVILEINHAGTALLGRMRSEIVGKRFAQLVALGDRPRFNTMLDVLCGPKGSPQDPDGRERCEVALLWPDGLCREVQVTATLRGRTRRRVLLAFEDITERKEREQTLRRSQHALLDADHRKDEFLGTLSHELRNPLVPIRNGLFVIRQFATAAPEVQRAVAIVDRQVNHLTRLIDDLLDVTRVAHGKIELQREVVEVGALVQQTLDDLRGNFDAGGIALEVHLGAGLFWVEGDPVRLVQIFSNLLGNALKFTPAGGRVMVLLERENAMCTLQIRDNGIGIPIESQQHLFKPFVQAPQDSNRRQGGLGLGLAVAKGLIDLHHGTLHLFSPGVGRGTEVKLSLPSGSAPSLVDTLRAEAPARSRRILIIEDNLDAAETMRDALTLDGHEVRLAGDGMQGLAAAQSFRPELVLCDIGLPGMDGYAVARAFRAAEGELHDVYLVALSGYARPADRQRAIEAGFNQHLAKPCSVTALNRLIAEAM